MRTTLLALMLGATAQLPLPARAEPADLCRELIAYGEKKAAQLRERSGQQAQRPPGTGGQSAGQAAAQQAAGPQGASQQQAQSTGQPQAGESQAGSPAGAPAPRGDATSSGTQGGGSVAANSSSDTSQQSSAPTTAPVASGAAPEAASSPHATDGANNAQGQSAAGTATPMAQVKLGANITLDQLRETAQRGDRQACRDTAQILRRAGADMPAELIALAAYEPDPAKRK